MTAQRADQTGGVLPGRSLLPWIGGSCAALFVPLLFPLLTGRVFTRDDLAAWHLPFRYLYREALRAGDSFLWTHAVLSGVYLHGEGEVGLAHPVHLLLYRFLPLGAAFNLELIASYVGLLAGTRLLLACLGLSIEAAWFGAMLFAFSGFTLFNLMHLNHIATVAHAPWLLLGTYLLMTSTDSKRVAWVFAAVAGVVASQLLMGNPQYVWITLIAVGYMALCLLYAGAPVTRALLLVGALICGALAGAVQLLPTLDFARESTRAAWSADQSLSFSLSPWNLVQLWSPFAFRFRVHAPPAEAQIVHEFIVYNGAFCTVGLVWLAMRWRQQTRRRLGAALLVFAALSLVLAMGRYAGVYAWLAQLPGVRVFRAPARHLVLFQLALSGLAAIVFDDVIGLVRRGETVAVRRLWPLAIPVALAVATTVMVALLAPSAWAAAHDLAFSGVLRAAPWSCFVVAAAGLLTLAARGRRWAVPLLIVLAAVDQGLWGYSYAYRWGPIQSIAELAASASVPPAAQPGDLIVPMLGGRAVNLPILRGLRLTTGYNGVEPVSILDPSDPLTERLVGATWRPSGTTWAPVSASMPRARLVSDAQVSRDVRADIRRIDVARVALVGQPIAPLSGAPGSVQVTTDRPGAIVVETDAEGRQLLVLTERFHAGWQATLDDRILDTTRVYGDYLGCVVEGGRHHVALTFAPESARLGLRASLAGLGLILATSTLLWRKTERPAAWHPRIESAAIE